MGSTRQCEKFASVVCVAFLNKPKIRINNSDSYVFLFSSSEEIKTDKKKKRGAHTHNANGDVGHLDHTSRFWFHRSPWFFSLLLSFFSLNFVFLALMDNLLFHWSFFFYFLFFIFIFYFFFFNSISLLRRTLQREMLVYLQ